MGFLDSLLKPDVEKLKARGDVERLIKALGYKKDATIRKSAAEGLIKALEYDKYAGSAATALREIRLGRAAESLLHVVLNDQDQDVRRTASESLTWIRHSISPKGQ